MIKFKKPNQLNGSQLRKELLNAGVTIMDEFTSVVVDGNDELWLDIVATDESTAATVVESHVGIDETIAKAAERAAILDRLGISDAEAKILLS